MKLQHIELSHLKLSPLNVRRHSATDELAELTATIRSLGVIQPLLVRPNCEGFEVIAGRLLACQAIAAEGGAVEPLPCAVMEEGDDAQALEASLAENIARLPMDEVDQYEAFAALIAQGRSIEDIAAQFGITEMLVKRRLAIAALIPPILDFYRAGDIDVPTIRHLTLATEKQQKAWLKLFKKGVAPEGRWLKEWLFGGEIPVSSALFPVEDYKGSIVADLFGEESYFADAGSFWKLQTKAIIERQAEYLNAGWSDVVIYDVGKSFQSYDKVKRPKGKGGKVYVASASNGEVSFHEGYLDQKEAARMDKAAARAEETGTGKAEPAGEKPELTQAAMRYIDLHRQNAVRAELLKAPGLALRLAVAGIIGCSSPWTVRPESQSANGNADTAASLKSNPATTAYGDELKAVRELLGFPGDGFLCAGGYHSIGSTKLLGRLLELSDADLLRILTLLMAESLAAGSEAVEAAGQLLAVDMEKWWTPDDAFFVLLRDKQAINAMIGELAGKQAASFSLKDKTREQLAVIRHCLAGTGGQQKVESWEPRYFRFPMQSYTKRKGIPTLERGNAVKKIVDRKS